MLSNFEAENAENAYLDRSFQGILGIPILLHDVVVILSLVKGRAGVFYGHRLFV